jgi:RNase H-fold protein (predicted Holliday junction resolvase)
LNVSPVDQLEAELKQLVQRWTVDQVVLGDGTGNQQIFSRLSNFFSPQTSIAIIDERNSSQEARGRYWRVNPARGLWKLIPTSMRVPPEPYDQYVALILIERYLAARNKHEGDI